MNRRKTIVPGVKKVAQDPPEIEIDKTRPVIEQKRAAGQHLLERNQQAGQFGQQWLLVDPPLIQTTAAELTFLVADVAELVVGRNELAEIDVIELETDPFDLVLDVTPDNPLQAVPLRGEQAQIEFGIKVLGDHLGILVRFEQHMAPVLEDGNL